MKWHIPLVVILAIQFTALSVADFQDVNSLENYDEQPLLEDDNDIETKPSSPEKLEEKNLDEAMKFLAALLVLPWPHDTMPLLYIENPEENSERFLDNTDMIQRMSPSKRTRYYRKYPWKRQNSRYDPTNPYICNPSKDDVYNLLMALHKARQGHRDRIVDFCKRKRPAFAVYTNIRYLGK